MPVALHRHGETHMLRGRYADHARMDTPKPHSADYFTDHRDHWWNEDYLALIARRFGFAELKSVLDVGCGVGHWGRTLLPHLPPSARVTGIDPEPRWVQKAGDTAASRG